MALSDPLLLSASSPDSPPIETFHLDTQFYPKAKSSVSIADTTPSDIYLDERPFRSPLKRRKSAMTVWMNNLSRRIGRRKSIYRRLCLLADTMCFLGLTGILLMIIINELTFNNNDDERYFLTWFIQLILTITTIILVGLLVYYHYVRLTLLSEHKPAGHLRFALTNSTLYLIVFEIFICSIHPFPRWIPFEIHQMKQNHSRLIVPKESINTISISSISFHVALGLPMFARLYLLCRLIMIRSHLFQNASSQSLGCLNQVSINFFFLVKTYLDRWPVRCLFTFCLCLFLIGSWSLRACNYTSPTDHASMFDSMWLFIVTFTTVGYGDLTPSTYCGRVVAAFTGVIGVFSTALLISVLAQKLQLTRSEKYVHHFDLNIQLSKERKHQAANIIKFAFQVWYLKQKSSRQTHRFLRAQRKLFRSIHLSQQLDQMQRNLTENCVGLPELVTLQRDIIIKTEQTEDYLMLMKARMKRMEDKLFHIDQTMVELHETLGTFISSIRHERIVYRSDGQLIH